MYYQFSLEAPLRVAVHQIVDERYCVRTYEYFYQFENDLNKWLILKDFDSHHFVDNNIKFLVNRQVYLEVTFLEIGKFKSISLFYAEWLDYNARKNLRPNRGNPENKSKKRKVKDRKLKQALQDCSVEKNLKDDGVRIKVRPCSRLNRKYDLW